MDDFWEKQMPDGDQPTENVTDEQLNNTKDDETAPAANSPDTPKEESEPIQTEEKPAEEEQPPPEAEPVPNGRPTTS